MNKRIFDERYSTIFGSVVDCLEGTEKAIHIAFIIDGKVHYSLKEDFREVYAPVRVRVNATKEEFVVVDTHENNFWAVEDKPGVPHHFIEKYNCTVIGPADRVVEKVQQEKVTAPVLWWGVLKDGGIIKVSACTHEKEYLEESGTVLSFYKPYAFLFPPDDPKIGCQVHKFIVERGENGRTLPYAGRENEVEVYESGTEAWVSLSKCNICVDSPFYIYRDRCQQVPVIWWGVMKVGNNIVKVWRDGDSYAGENGLKVWKAHFKNGTPDGPKNGSQVSVFDQFRYGDGDRQWKDGNGWEFYLPHNNEWFPSGEYMYECSHILYRHRRPQVAPAVGKEEANFTEEDLRVFIINHFDDIKKIIRHAFETGYNRCKADKT